MSLNHPKVWVSTCAYNAERTIRRAIESVLSQTYDNICYIIRDNGSTDATLEICREYERQDARVQVFHNRVNHAFGDSEEDQAAKRAEWSVRFHEPPVMAAHDFSCILDADDTYSPDFFQRAVELANDEDLDIVASLTEMIVERTGEKNAVLLPEKPLIICGEGFSEYFQNYHWYLRQMWGKLFRPRVLVGYFSYIENYLKKTYDVDAMPYGADTIYALHNASNARRIGILPMVGHHYYVQEKSLSTVYLPKRADTDWILHHETERFLLNKCGYISEKNRHFLGRVYANAVIDTTMVIENAAIPIEEKLHECRRIAEHPVTRENFSLASQDAAKGRKRLLTLALSCHDAKTAAEDLGAVLAAMAPKCAAAFAPENVPLLSVKPALAEGLLRDDQEALLRTLLEMLRRNEQSKKYDLCAIVRALSSDKPILRDCCDRKFLHRYGDIYFDVWQGKYEQALDEMTGLLLDGKKVDEAFIQLYLLLAAQQGQATAFVFGKIQLAKLLQRNGDHERCRAILQELAEMGVEDNEDITAIKTALQDA